MGARRRDAAARAGRRRRAVRRIARSRVAHRRPRAVVVCAGAPARSLVRAARARRPRCRRPAYHVDAGERERHERVVELPAPMRDARVLRTLALLDLESNPPPAAIDRVTVGVDVTEGRVLQFGLFARALPTDTLATLLARLGALMGTDRIGAPSLVDTYRPGAFAMATFDPPRSFTTPNPQSPIPESQVGGRFAAISKSYSSESGARAGPPCPRDDRSPWYGRRPRRALRRPMALVRRLVEERDGTAMNGTWR